MRFTRDSDTFLFIAVYACPQEKWRKFLWRNLELLASSISEPWLLGGDFNAILASHERKDASGRHGLANRAFQNCVSNSNLLDLGFSGSKFTWKRGNFQARLDRYLCNSSWRLAYPEGVVLHLPRVGSDHCPILLKDGCPPPSRCNRPFRFQAAWHPDFEDFIKQAWNTDGNMVSTTQKFVAKVQEWNKRVFGNIHWKKKRVLARLAGIQRFLENRPSPYLSKLELELKMEFDAILLQEEVFWVQKARWTSGNIEICWCNQLRSSYLQTRQILMSVICALWKATGNGITFSHVYLESLCWPYGNSLPQDPRKVMTL
ncbi:hypothetical protein Tsubulata_006712 [Turnera subulata]|uniref:Endonuclease/exonuclease/phosphatase domain-containing protein n=1 Tax=Turnera subulata TaxID=218843 RepID=A0A9Q0JPV0_9ROSI|nr:hypothetical protein Tsubulata_006712 [Turnera subulata]